MVRPNSRRALRRYRRFVVFRHRDQVRCSCQGCRNPRTCSWNPEWGRQGRRTKQERASYLSYLAQLEEVHDSEDS